MYDIPGQDVLTRDSVTVRVDAVVFCRVSSPLLAVCGDGDYKVTTRYKAQTAIRNVLGTKNLTQILADRDGISREMVDNLQVHKPSIFRMTHSVFGYCARLGAAMQCILHRALFSYASWLPRPFCSQKIATIHPLHFTLLLLIRQG